MLHQQVFKGTLTAGEVVAIKRAQHGSMQGAFEFKTEIELLSRIHHKNVVSLVGFCYEQGEQMLVYEYIPKGTLRESLSGKNIFLHSSFHMFASEEADAKSSPIWQIRKIDCSSLKQYRSVH